MCTKSLFKENNKPPTYSLQNACGKGKFPILRAINKVFKGEVKLWYYEYDGWNEMKQMHL